MQLLVSLILISLSLVGIADAGYISWYTWLGTAASCGGNFDCSGVLTSDWAQIGPVSVSYLGLAYYFTVFFVGLLHFIDIEKGIVSKKLQKYRVTPIEILWLLTLLGFLFSLYLVSVMAFAIGEWCKYCLISAATSTSLFLTTSFYLKFFLKKPAFLLRRLTQKKLGVFYRYIVKPLCFLLDAEFVHTRFVRTGEVLGRVSLMRTLLRLTFAVSDKRLETKIAGLSFPNKIGLAAGFDYNGQLTNALPAIGFGWHTIGTVTLKPYGGNTKPRLGRFPNSRALLVNKGLKNIGAQAIISKLQNLEFSIPTGISIASTNKRFGSTRAQILDIVQCFWLFEHSKVKHQYYELNISCPNTFDGEPFTTCERLNVLLSALDQLQLTRPMFIKMPIDQSEQETKKMLEIAAQHTVAGVIFGNLTKDKDNPAVTTADQEVWKAVRGNLSGKPTWERSNRLIALTKKEFGNRFIIIGTGGIFSPEDAAEKIRLGADLVQLISGMIFRGPQLIGEINLEQCYNTP